MPKQKVTLYMSGELWREFRAQCVRMGVSASEVTEGLIAQHVGGKWAALIDGAPIDSGDDEKSGQHGVKNPHKTH